MVIILLYWPGADLVIEIVSPDNPERDTKGNRAVQVDAVLDAR